ncbi:MAG: hypothetical protein JSS11_16665 [Verrucomicrobia bacterium]|nr:hypothetical protein [Verrucomicrobiota bacterium]
MISAVYRVCLLGLCSLALSACQQPTQKDSTPVATVTRTGRFPDTRFPLLEAAANQSASERIERSLIENQPWLKGDLKPPTALSDLGLKGKLSLIDYGGDKASWGTRVVIADSSGHIFAFFSGQVRKGESDDFVDAFYLGGVTPRKGMLRVFEGSPSYRFLFRLVWSFSRDARYRPSKATLERARAQLNLTESEFEELLTEPPQT